MSTVWEVFEFRKRLANDPENREARRSLHENYEWLEGYWRSQFGEDFIEQAWQTHGKFYWESVPAIKELANSLAKLRPVGDSNKENYEPNDEVVAATDLLRKQDKTSNHHFRALMIIVRQIRNNMFHGKKMELMSEEQYQRNKELVKLAAQITGLILENLQ